MRRLMAFSTMIAGSLLATGCASSIMNGFVGQSVQQVMVKYGPPTNAFDMGDGRRAFQWVMNSSYMTPASVNQTGNATVIGNSVMWTNNTQISGGYPITNSCAYTMYGRWSEDRHLWILESYEKPKMMCE